LTIASGGSVTLTASGANSYTWSTGESTTAITISNITSATTLSVTGTTGACLATASAAVSVTTVPCSLTASIAVSPSLTICPGSVAMLMASGGATYRWSTTETTPAINVGISGVVSVTVSSLGCSATATVTVSVTNPAPLSAPILTASSVAVCEGGVVSVSATVNGTVTYQWYKDGQSLGSAQQGPVLSLAGVQGTQAGSYVLVIQATGCASATSTAVQVTVNPLPTVVLVFPGSATVVANGSFPTVTVPAGQELTYQVRGGVLYERKIEIDRINGYLINQVQSNANGIFPIDRLGLYTITVTGANGCQRTVQGIITTAPGR